jgi:hypothetical protein
MEQLASPTLTAEGEKLEGFLLKQGAKGFRKSFKKRWFALHTNRLYYFHNKGDTQSIGFIDIMLASSILPSGSAKSCEFQINTPGRTYTLVASTEQEMKSWVNALNNHRQKLIKQSREHSADSALGGMHRRQSIGSFEEAKTAAQSRPAGVPVRGFHTLTTRERKQMIEPPEKKILSASLPTVAGAAAVEAATNSPVNRDRRKSNADVVSEELCTENQRLQVKIAKAEREIENRGEVVTELKSTVLKELKGLADRHRATEIEMQRLRDEISMSKTKIQELVTNNNAAAAANNTNENTNNDTNTNNNDANEEIQKLKEQLKVKDAQIEDQSRQIALLKAKLEVKIEEEASRMKEKVKATMEKLRAEHEEQLRRSFVQEKLAGRTAEEWKKLEESLTAQNRELRAQLDSALSQIANLSKSE